MREPMNRLLRKRFTAHKELVGESPMQYSSRWRMNVALTWLKKEDVSPGELDNR